jgi:hypothetical protein
MATIDGTPGNDPNLDGTNVADTINGFGGADTMRGLDGDDTLVPGAGGSDTIDGGAGIDTLTLTGNYADYTIGYSGANIVLTIGTTVETVTNVEKIVFADKPVRLVGSGSEHATIQSAVNAASNGETILVAGGTYVEQVTISGKSNIALAAGPGQAVTIQAPADLAQNATSSSGREIHAVVAVIDGTNVTLDGIEIDGAGVGDTVSGINPNFIGVFYRNSSGGMTNVDVTSVRLPYEPGTTPGGHPILSAVTQGFGVQVNNDSTLPFAMTGGTISDFQVVGAVFSNTDLDVSGVTIIGGGDQTLRTQNGIQVSNSTGIITGNTITGIGYAGADPTYDSGILGFDNTAMAYTNNTIVGANGENANAKVVGIFTDTANSDIIITGNNISQVDMAIIGTGNVSPVGYVVNNNTITNIDTADAFYNSAGAILFTPDETAAMHNVVGSDFNDNLFGGFNADNFDGRGGNDLLSGRGGSDVLAGGAGNDRLDGGFGADAMNGGTGNDTFFVDDAGDTITEAVNAGIETVNTALNNYSLFAIANVERLVFTGFGNFVGRGNGLDNRIQGGLGNDRFVADQGGADRYFGDAGLADQMDFRASATGAIVNLTTGVHGGAAAGDVFSSIEYFYGSNTASDSFTGAAFNDRLDGYGGADTLIGAGGSDTLNGGEGDDEISGGALLDFLSGNAGADDFNYFQVSESGPTSATRDRILDFATGSDDIDVSAIDAIASTGADDAFTAFIGNAAFSAEGQIRAFQSGANTVIEFNTTGVSGAEMQIQLNNFTAATLSFGDFIA